jgi:hypothetical protein
MCLFVTMRTRKRREKGKGKRRGKIKGKEEGGKKEKNRTLHACVGRFGGDGGGGRVITPFFLPLVRGAVCPQIIQRACLENFNKKRKEKGKEEGKEQRKEEGKEGQRKAEVGGRAASFFHPLIRGTVCPQIIQRAYLK